MTSAQSVRPRCVVRTTMVTPGRVHGHGALGRSHGRVAVLYQDAKMFTSHAVKKVDTDWELDKVQSKHAAGE